MKERKGGAGARGPTGCSAKVRGNDTGRARFRRREKGLRSSLRDMTEVERQGQGDGEGLQEGKSRCMLGGPLSRRIYV